MEQTAVYVFQCGNCGLRMKAQMMPNIEIMRKIGYNINCPKCGARTSIIQEL